MARPSKLTPEAQALICRAIEGGSTRADAAEYAGVGKTTFYQWQAKGDAAKSGPYREFVDALARSEAVCRVMMVNVIAKAAAEGDWRAAESYLKRRARADWGDQVAVEHSGEVKTILVNLGEDVSKL